METFTRGQYDRDENARVTETLYLDEDDMSAAIGRLLQDDLTSAARWKVCRERASKIETVIERR